MSINYPLTERFWLEEPICLFRNATLIPVCGMTAAARLNALTRLIIVITLILWLACIGQWWLFLLLGLLLVLILYYLDHQAVSNNVLVENYVCRRRKPIKRVTFDLNPRRYIYSQSGEEEEKKPQRYEKGGFYAYE